MKCKLIGLIMVLGLAGCAVVPDEIKVPDDTALVTYSRAVTGGEQVEGKPARWGGIIVGVENKPQRTLVEVVHFPLNHYGKPNTSAETVGRFKAQISGFVDPIIFEEGRYITFLGDLVSPTAGMVGEQPYMYPTLSVKDYYLWRKERTYDVSTLYFDMGTGWYSPFYYPFYHRGWGFRSSRIRVIEQERDRPRIPRTSEFHRPSDKHIQNRTEPVRTDKQK